MADDESSIRRLVRASLSSPTCRVVEAVDGDEAWAALERERPTLALLDVQMPGRTGLDVTRAIRAHPEMSSIRVVLLSAKAQPGDIDAGLAAGADQSMTKPFSVVELLQAVERQVGPIREGAQ